MHEPQAKANLLTKTLCSGEGLFTRFDNHCPCKTKTWHPLIGCGGAGFDVDSHPCIECGINTCDECRIHMLYQVSVEDKGLDNHRWWSGYVMSTPVPFAIYPPKGGDNPSWYLPVDMMKPHHDQGRLHIPLHIDSIADPEPLDRILDVDLGRGYICPYGRFSPPYDGIQLVSVFNMVARARKEMLCIPCFDKQLKDGHPPCSCTFRKRFLDRWVCMPCHMRQVSSDNDLEKRLLVDRHSGRIVARTCRCNATFNEVDDYRTICNWCNGEIHDIGHAEDDEEDEDTGSFEDHEDEDDIAAETPADLLPNEMRPVENKDGTLSVFFNGARISGERLSRGLITAWMVENGHEFPCTCCACPSRGCQHSHDDGHDHDGIAEEDDETVEGRDDESMDEDENMFLEDVLDFDEEETEIEMDSDMGIDEELD
jgi:hypothetical protein